MKATELEPAAVEAASKVPAEDLDAALTWTASFLATVLTRLGKQETYTDIDTAWRALKIMRELRQAGWTVGLKCQPDGMEWLREAESGRYESTGIKTTWCAHAEFYGKPWRHSQTAVDDYPHVALEKLQGMCEQKG